MYKYNKTVKNKKTEIQSGGLKISRILNKERNYVGTTQNTKFRRKSYGKKELV